MTRKRKRPELNRPIASAKKAAYLGETLGSLILGLTIVPRPSNNFFIRDRTPILAVSP